jgi:hypothetical protein
LRQRDSPNAPSLGSRQNIAAVPLPPYLLITVTFSRDLSG